MTIIDPALIFFGDRPTIYSFLPFVRWGNPFKDHQCRDHV